MPGVYAFTAIAPGRSSVLKSPCDIEPASGTSGAFCSFNAIWDTGATHSVILQEVVGRCGLKPIGKTYIAHAGINEEPDLTDVYMVNIRLPNHFTVANVPVSRGGFSGGDVLIGMDIIGTGDFAITHAKGQTKFTFQIPPQADIDFVAERNRENVLSRQSSPSQQTRERNRRRRKK